MKRSIINLIIPTVTLAILATVGMGVPAAVSASGGHLPACPYEPAANRTIVQFDGARLVSNGTEDSAKSSHKPVTLSAGTYTVTLFSHDGFPGRSAISQPHESWFVKFFAGEIGRAHV